MKNLPCSRAIFSGIFPDIILSIAESWKGLVDFFNWSQIVEHIEVGFDSFSDCSESMISPSLQCWLSVSLVKIIFFRFDLTVARLLSPSYCLIMSVQVPIFITNMVWGAKLPSGFFGGYGNIIVKIIVISESTSKLRLATLQFKNLTMSVSGSQPVSSKGSPQTQTQSLNKSFQSSSS